MSPLQNIVVFRKKLSRYFSSSSSNISSPPPHEDIFLLASLVGSVRARCGAVVIGGPGFYFWSSYSKKFVLPLPRFKEPGRLSGGRGTVAVGRA